MDVDVLPLGEVPHLYYQLLQSAQRQVQKSLVQSPKLYQVLDTPLKLRMVEPGEFDDFDEQYDDHLDNLLVGVVSRLVSQVAQERSFE